MVGTVAAWLFLVDQQNVKLQCKTGKYIGVDKN